MNKQFKDINSDIKDDIELLNLMLVDTKKFKDIYLPGPYWKKKTQSAANEIYKFGLKEFRGIFNGAATSFGDNAYIDIRTNYNYGLRILFSKIFRDIYPFNKIFDNQVNLTFRYFKEIIKYKNFYLKNNNRINNLISKYNFNFETTKGGCLSFFEVDGKKISHLYLELLDTLDRMGESFKICNKKTFFEIGGGFGINVHLMVELFNIKKIIYLDIAPNLYVATQYLKSFYGKNVIDYRINKDMEFIEFNNTNELEIFCITPPQIEKIKSKIELFHNANSFVEMTENIIQNYADKIKKVMSTNNSIISLVSYDGFDLNTSINPEKLPKFFSRTADKAIFENILPNKSRFHYIIK